MDAELIAREGRVRIPYGDLPIPLLHEEFNALGGFPPSYDAIGRGIYQALRIDPDCTFAERYAFVLKEAYPHFLSELASNILMLDKKDIDIAYLDRKITCLKVFSKIEPDNPCFPLEIGLAFLEMGTSLAALHRATASLYQAEEYLQRAVELSPDVIASRHHLAEVSYLLGKYDIARCIWHGIIPSLPREEAQKLEERADKVAEGSVPLVPMVDYLESAGIAFDCYQQGEWEEAAAILYDILGDEVLQADFPLPELWYVLGMCCVRLEMPSHAGEYLKQAIELKPNFAEAREALASIRS